jgi:hypothetical protein
MTAHWGLPDPARAKGSDAERQLVFADTLRKLSNRIGIFVTLPLYRLSKLSLQTKLTEVGTTPTEAPKQTA